MGNKKKKKKLKTNKKKGKNPWGKNTVLSSLSFILAMLDWLKEREDEEKTLVLLSKMTEFR